MGISVYICCAIGLWIDSDFNHFWQSGDRHPPFRLQLRIHHPSFNIIFTPCFCRESSGGSKEDNIRYANRSPNSHGSILGCFKISD